MNTILDPTGGRPATVYWRRRAIVFVALAIGVLLLARACGTGGPGDLSKGIVQQAEVPLLATYTPTPSPTPVVTANVVPAVPATASPTTTKTTTPQATVAATPSPTPTSDGEAAGPLPCAKKALTVKLKADERTYGAKAKPKLFLGVKNDGPNACTVDLGSKALSFVVVSGKDRIWSSDDCQGKGTSDVRLLKPGEMLWARSVWSKVRSKPGCPKGLPEARPGTYLVEGSAGGVKANKRAVFQLN